MSRSLIINIAALSSLAFALCIAASSAQAQTAERPSRTQQQPLSSSTATPPGDEAEADLSITARVTARELLFRKVPNPKVEFTGRPRRETVWEAERENLPAEVRPGVTYRDIGIKLRITSVFADIERIVAEALGEVPVTDDAPPAQPDAPPPPTPQPSQPSASTSPSSTHAPVRNSTTQPRRTGQPRAGRGQ
ncbi:MAG TPA: hypothetical protein VFS10_00500 [Pyrinomonadaceae bacterium]|nr:hypothetical protein [Pyrinomonadaceae bacterium]